MPCTCRLAAKRAGGGKEGEIAIFFFLMKGRGIIIFYFSDRIFHPFHRVQYDTVEGFSLPFFPNFWAREA